MSVHQFPLWGSIGPEDSVPDFGKKTVPLIVWLKDGHMVNPGTPGAERHVIGEADVDGTMVYMTLMGKIPDAIMDSLVGDDGARFSIGFSPDGE